MKYIFKKKSFSSPSKNSDEKEKEEKETLKKAIAKLFALQAKTITRTVILKQSSET